MRKRLWDLKLASSLSWVTIAKLRDQFAERLAAALGGANAALCIVLGFRVLLWGGPAGRLATALGGADTALRVVLGPPEAWRAAQEADAPSGGASAVRIAGARAPASAPAAAARFQALQEQFRRAHHCRRAWTLFNSNRVGRGGWERRHSR